MSQSRIITEKEKAIRLHNPECHIPGKAVGVVKQHAAQNEHLSLPIVISDIANSILHSTEQPPDPEQQQEILLNLRKARRRQGNLTFEMLWKQGFWVTEGSKFGSTWLAYEGDTLRFHATFAIAVDSLVWPSTSSSGSNVFMASDLVAFVRVCNTASKIAVISHETKDEKCLLVTLEWKG